VKSAIGSSIEECVGRGRNTYMTGSRMQIKEILGQLKLIDVSGNLEMTFEGISSDSRSLKKGNLFFALSGGNSSGNEFVDDAISRGASAVITEEELHSQSVPIIRVADIRNSMGYVSHYYYGNPSRSLICTAITGTNGKTTTSYLIDSILKQRHSKTTVIGTLGMTWEESTDRTGLTTPESHVIAAALARMRNEGCAAVTMEASSHGLALGRVAGIEFDLAVFTNLSRDHLDFHGDMENYMEANLSLFRGLGMGEKEGMSVVNMDDPRGNRFVSETKVGGVTYSAGGEKADVQATDYHLRPHGSDLVVRSPFGKTSIWLSLPGRFNISNALASFAAGVCLNMSEGEIVRGIESVKRVRGRMQMLEKGGVRVVIDYAHTPDALENLLTTIDEIFEGRLIVVIGCGGDRDREKRPIMGEVAARLSDILILTSDNPRSEDPEAILDGIEEGARMVRSDLSRVTDREEALECAIGMATRGDIVVIAGKGHEDYQIVGNERRHFDDCEVVSRLLGCEGPPERVKGESE